MTVVVAPGSAGYVLPSSVVSSSQPSAVTSQHSQFALRDFVSVKDNWSGSGGATGNGTTDDTAALLAACAEAPGTIWVPAGTYLFDSQLAIPNDCTMLLAHGATLNCAVTGGGVGITLGKGAMITGSGGGGGSTSTMSGVIGKTTCNVSALIAPANAFQEYAYIKNLNILPEGAATVGALVSANLYANSQISGCILNANSIANNCLLLPNNDAEAGPAQLSIFNNWFTSAVQDSVLAESTTGGGVLDLWFLHNTWVGWGFGYAALHLAAAASVGILMVSLRDNNMEIDTSPTSATYFINLSGSGGTQSLQVDHLTMDPQGTSTNLTGVNIASGTAYQGITLSNINGEHGPWELLNDASHSPAYTFTGYKIEHYEQGYVSGALVYFGDTIQTRNSVQVLVTAGVPSDASFEAAPPNGTLAINGATNGLYVRVAGVWQPQPAAGSATTPEAFLFTATNAAWTIPTGCTHMEITCVGGGGGGSGGGAASSAIAQCGGAGGTAGTASQQLVATGSATTLAITIGVGGAGGTGGTASGGAGGAAGFPGDTTVTGTGISVAGRAASRASGALGNSVANVNSAYYGTESAGSTGTVVTGGMGGAALTSTALGGGAPVEATGGGGSAGQAASATVGGLGGNTGTGIVGGAQITGTGGNTGLTAGGTGGSAPANSGAGGGGGGGGAWNAGTGPGAGGTGGAGGSGRVEIVCYFN